jgi:hypothetical protein
MPPWLADPQVRDALIVLLTLYPLARILKRLGLKPVYALLALASVIIPLLGHMLVAFYAVSQRWPALPAIIKKPRRTS